MIVYALTLAPSVTFWDAGEFIAAIRTFGIPHPPGTPLYVSIGRAWSVLLPGVPSAVATNLMSAVATASACAVLASLFSRWMHSEWLGVACAVAAGVVSTVWLNATETEVYAASLLLGATMLLAGSWAARPGREDPLRSKVLLAYLIGLAGPLHPSALLAAPGAIVLASHIDESRIDWMTLAALLAVLLAAAGISTGSLWMLVAAAAAVASVAIAAMLINRADIARLAGLALLALAVASTALLIMFVRARHDPAINQGNPSTWSAFLEVVGRKQYAVSPPWPRRTKLWLQLANVMQYADWQFGLGLSRSPLLSIPRLAVTIAYVSLGTAGAAVHRNLHRQSWRAVTLVLLCGTLGAAAWLNLRAGPTIGYGILPPDAEHEPRERDYFFALGFWVWGAWAALGAWFVASRVARPTWARRLALAAAAMPILLNWRAVNRRAQPEAELPRAFARGLLLSMPRRAVLVVEADNDTYPLWYLQRAERVREDVTLVTIPLLGADWYRDELARRDSILPSSRVVNFTNTDDMLARLAAFVQRTGRPLLADVSVEVAEREAMGGGWTYRGFAFQQGDEGAPDRDLRAIHQAAEYALGSGVLKRPVGPSLDVVPAYIQNLMRCPLAMDTATERRRERDALAPQAVAQLASTCNFK